MSKKIVTHNGHFHTDDVLASAALKLLYPDAEIIRSRDMEIIKSADIAIDVGGVYDPALHRFDHHQPGGAGKRVNGIPYASFGLVWKEYGAELAGGPEEAALIEEKIAMPVDAIDSGFEIESPTVPEVRSYTFGDFLDSYMTGAETLPELDTAFYKVLPIATELLEREISSAKSTVADWRETRRIYEESADKRVILMPKPGSWKRVLIPTEALFVVSERPDGKWQARAVPAKVHSFELKKPFPESWAGKRDAEIAGLSGVPDATFCHNDRFIAVAMSKEGALALAHKARQQ